VLESGGRVGFTVGKELQTNLPPSFGEGGRERESDADEMWKGERKGWREGGKVLPPSLHPSHIPPSLHPSLSPCLPSSDSCKTISKILYARTWRLPVPTMARTYTHTYIYINTNIYMFHEYISIYIYMCMAFAHSF